MGRYSTSETSLYVQYGDWLARNWANISFYETPKIAVRETGSRIVATLDSDQRYLLSSLYSVSPRLAGEPHSLPYLLGIINSLMATWFERVIALDPTQGAFTKFRTNQLARLPIRPMDSSDPADVARHDRMVGLVESMLDLHKRLPAATMQTDRDLLQRQITATDKQIDALVYELYGLTEEEVGIVEGSSA